MLLKVAGSAVGYGEGLSSYWLTLGASDCSPISHLWSLICLMSLYVWDIILIILVIIIIDSSLFPNLLLPFPLRLELGGRLSGYRLPKKSQSLLG